jgi:curved DNA-binding protein CbpA/uncharacterized RDD family membrane protein YckC
MPQYRDDYYEILQVSRRASQEVIQAAYERLSQMRRSDGGEAELELLNEAYKILANQKRRTVYDMWLQVLSDVDADEQEEDISPVTAVDIPVPLLVAPLPLLSEDKQAPPEEAPPYTEGRQAAMYMYKGEPVTDINSVRGFHRVQKADGEQLVVHEDDLEPMQQAQEGTSDDFSLFMDQLIAEKLSNLSDEAQGQESDTEQQEETEAVAEPQEPSSLAENEYENEQPFPFYRLAARYIDTTLHMSLVLLLVGIFLFIDLVGGGSRPDDFDFLVTFVGTPIGILSFPFIEAAFLSYKGYTLGKMLIGAKVCYQNGNLLNYNDALTRSFKVLFKGVGLWIPVINLIALAFSYNRPELQKQNSWDISLGSVIVQKKISYVRRGVIIGLFFFVLTLNIVDVWFLTNT